uniref:Kinase n=1 Tax=Macrostomum lignano TaxID=282301 RepID=A0A1I8F795_9PLAT
PSVEVLWRTLNTVNSRLSSELRSLKPRPHRTNQSTVTMATEEAWTQLSGSRPGRVMKRTLSAEADCLQRWPATRACATLRPHSTAFVGVRLMTATAVVRGVRRRCQDLLAEFQAPVSLMDCKIGCRTYLEDELAMARRDAKPRPDMYRRASLKPTRTLRHRAESGARSPSWTTCCGGRCAASTPLGLPHRRLKRGDPDGSVALRRLTISNDCAVGRHSAMLAYFVDGVQAGAHRLSFVFVHGRAGRASCGMTRTSARTRQVLSRLKHMAQWSADRITSIPDLATNEKLMYGLSFSAAVLQFGRRGSRHSPVRPAHCSCLCRASSSHRCLLQQLRLSPDSGQEGAPALLSPQLPMLGSLGIAEVGLPDIRHRGVGGVPLTQLWLETLRVQSDVKLGHGASAARAAREPSLQGLLRLIDYRSITYKTEVAAGTRSPGPEGFGLGSAWQPNWRRNSLGRTGEGGRARPESFFTILPQHIVCWASLASPVGQVLQLPADNGAWLQTLRWSPAAGSTVLFSLPDDSKSDEKPSGSDKETAKDSVFKTSFGHTEAQAGPAEMERLGYQDSQFARYQLSGQRDARASGMDGEALGRALIRGRPLNSRRPENIPPPVQVWFLERRFHVGHPATGPVSHSDAGPDRLFRGHGHTLEDVHLREGMFPRERRMIVSLDTSPDESDYLWLDERNLIGRFEAGIIGQDLEARLAELGYCIGHEPDSLEFSSLGAGWPLGVRHEEKRLRQYRGPASARDVCLRQLALFEKKLRRASGERRAGRAPLIMARRARWALSPRPDATDRWCFADFASGVRCLRELALRRCAPASVRLMDNEHSATPAPAASGWTTAFVDAVKRFYVTRVRGFKPDELAVATLLYEAPRRRSPQ